MPTEPPVAADSSAARLRAARLGAGLTFAAAAERIGVTRACWYQYETGRRNPSLEWLLRAARALGVDPHSMHPDLAPARPQKIRKIV